MTMPDTPTMPADRPVHGPERHTADAYASALNSITHYPWPEGVTPRDTERDVMLAIAEIAQVYADGDAERAVQLTAEKLPDVPEGWEPLCYFEAVAEQMAFPMWEHYSAEQRDRGYRYAARWVKARLDEWMRPRRLDTNGEPAESCSFRDLPRAVQLAYADAVVGRAEYQRMLGQVRAYLATHPDDEFEPGQLRAIVTRFSDFRLPQAFF